MAYRINDEIFFLKIDEQVEYLTQVINELYSKDIKIINTNINNLSAQVNNLNETKQDKTSDELKTEVKNIVGSINELFDKIESETNRAVNSENGISTNLTEFENHVNPILDSHTSSISSINDSIKSLQDNKQSKIDEQLQTTSKEVVGAINENHDAIVTNEALIDTKQDKNDSSLETTSKTIVGSINEVNKKINDSLYTVRIAWENFASSVTEATDIWNTFTDEEKDNLLNNDNCVIYPTGNFEYKSIDYPLFVNNKWNSSPTQEKYVKWLGLNGTDHVVGRNYLLCLLKETGIGTNVYTFKCYKVNRFFSDYVYFHSISVFNPSTESDRITIRLNIYDSNKDKITLRNAYKRIGIANIVASGRFKSTRNIVTSVFFGPDNVTVEYYNNETYAFEYEDVYFNQSNINLSDTVFEMKNKFTN